MYHSYPFYSHSPPWFDLPNILSLFYQSHVAPVSVFLVLYLCDPPCLSCLSFSRLIYPCWRREFNRQVRLTPFSRIPLTLFLDCFVNQSSIDFCRARPSPCRACFVVVD
eukprot:c49755_g1_i1 orf=1-324(-)